MSLSSKQIVVALLLSGAGVTLFVVNPETTAYLPCLFKKMTGLQCPGCGAARASYHLLHGNILSAIDYNILLVFFIPFLVLEGMYRLRMYSDASRLNVVRTALTSYRVLFVVVVFWIIRNIPLYPFTRLSSDL